MKPARLSNLLCRSTARRAALLGLAGAVAVGAHLHAPSVFTLGVSQAQAQGISAFGDLDEDAQMFLEADELLYNDADNTVTALGRVTIFYDGYTVNADEVIYDRGESRVLANGNVELIDPTGSVLRATSADLSDTLADGFVDALTLETTERTFFTARNATRRDGSVTVFEDSTYTACEACPDNPDGPRAWMFHADTITYDQAEQMVYYRNVRLDFYGVPIAWLPFFAHPDPTVERKSGFLRPNYVADGELGVGASIPYYFALDPSYDLTVTGTGLSQQGLHLNAEWRQRLETGQYSLRASGIRQLDPGAFSGQPGDEEWRGGLATNGSFSLNQHWDWGWNLYWQSDRRYFRDYSIETSSDQVVSDIFLTGLHERSFFDARVERIEVSSISRLNQNQAWTLPVVDYDRRFTPDHFGGELRLEANLTSTLRQDSDIEPINLNGIPGSRYEGLEGQSARATIDVGWRREFIGPLGQVFTPQVGFRADAIGFNLDNTANFAGLTNGEDSVFRAMPSAGLEWRWPFLISTSGSSHVVEPIAQLIVRPDASDSSPVPIEDSQSLVFDAASLFEWDKFSGYDQLEGGTRANVGGRYTGTFANGLSINALFGQSFHIAGTNPYATPNLQLRNEADSGLETDQSDYVAMAGFSLRNAVRLAASGRFDENDFSLERGEVRGSLSIDHVQASAIYGYLAAQPNRGRMDEHHGVFGSLGFNLNEGWRATGSVRYDIDDEQVMGVGLGLAYRCDCYGVGLQFTHIPADANEGVEDNRLMLNISLRTIGGYQASVLGGGSSSFGTILPGN